MRLEALLVAAGLAVATAGSAAASPDDSPAACAGKNFLAEMVCEMQHQAATARPVEQREDAWSLIDRIMHPRTAFDWFRARLDQANNTMISSSTRPSTRPAATAPSDVGHL